MAYATWRQLADEVREKVDNASWDVTRIEPIINRIYVRVCEHEKVHLPDLETQGTVTTSTTLSYVALPTDIQIGRKRAVFKVLNTSQNNVEIPIYSSLSVLLSKFDDYNASGTLEGCAKRGGYLHYQRIPLTAETLAVFYFKRTTLLASPEISTPAHIPSEDLAWRLLVHGACAEIFPQIYQDAPQTHPMVVWHTQEYNKAFQELLSYVGPWDMGFDSFSG